MYFCFSHDHLRCAFTWTSSISNRAVALTLLISNIHYQAPWPCQFGLWQFMGRSWAKAIIRNLEPNWQNSCSEIVACEDLIRAKIFASILHLGSQFWNKKIEYFSWHWKYQQTFACVSLRYRNLHLPRNLCKPLETFACVSLRYRKRRGRGVDGNTGSGLW